MGTLYLVTLFVGLGTILVQLLLSTDKDAHGAFDVDSVDADGSTESHFDAGADGDADHGEADGLAPLAVLLSLRFWTFSLMSFGLFGSFLHFLSLADPAIAAAAATVMGLFCGWFASWAFFKLSSSSTNSGADSSELLGQVGRVILPPNEAGRAKVRLRVKGQLIDYLATTDGELEAGSSVMVEEVRGNQVHVSPAPSGLKFSE